MGYSKAVALAVLATMSTIEMHAQRRVPAQRVDTTVPITAALKAGAASYDVSAKGTCSHAPVASIYNLRAERWTVEQSDADRSLTLSLWHPATGSDLVSLNLSAAGKRHSMSTIKVGSNGTVEGSGTITLAKSGNGGTFTVNATAADGTKISGTVKCDAFTAAIAEGGN